MIEYNNIKIDWLIDLLILIFKDYDISSYIFLRLLGIRSKELNRIFIFKGI